MYIVQASPEATPKAKTKVLKTDFPSPSLTLTVKKAALTSNIEFPKLESRHDDYCSMFSKGIFVKFCIGASSFVPYFTSHFSMSRTLPKSLIDSVLKR